MKYRAMGSHGPLVSAIGFGCWPMGAEDYGPIDDREMALAVDRAIDVGVTLFDTAPAYGHGRAETVLGEMLGPRRKDIVLVSKCGLHWDWEANPRPFRRDSSRAAILDGPGGLHEQLRRLRTDYLDVWMVHWPDVNVPFQETMEVLVSARDSGKVRHVGVSNFSPPQLRACKQLAPLVTNQVGYNLFDRRWEIHAFETCRELDISVMAYGSLAHGLLSGTWDRATRLDATDWRSRGMAFRQPLLTEENLPQNLDVVDRLMDVAARVGVSLPQLALAWVLRDEVVATALVGCRRPSEVDDNLGALDLSIDDEVLGELDCIMQGAAGQVQELPA